MSMRTLSAVTLLPLALLGTACRSTFTEVRLQNPERASFRSRTDPSSVILPEGRQAARVEIQSGFLRAGEDMRVPYRLQAVREPDGAMSLDDGRLRDIVKPSGQVVMLPGDVLSVEDMHAPALLIPICAEIRIGNGASTSFECRPSTTRLGYLATPWENVNVIQRRVQRTGLQAAAAGVAIGGFVLACASIGPFTAASPGDPSYRPLMATGTAMLIVPAVVFAALAPFAFAKDRVEIVYPPPAAP